MCQGIVVGDRAAHQATLHLLQLCYFSLFHLALSLPWALPHLTQFPAFLRTHPAKVSSLPAARPPPSAQVVLATAGLAALVQYSTLAHPYLLADNRHLTFYLWRRVFMRHWTVKFLLIPAYIFGFYHMARCRCFPSPPHHRPAGV